MTRTVFFISDGTGITAENLGRSLLSQFELEPFDCLTIPYINTVDRAEAALQKLEAAKAACVDRPIVFATLVNSNLRALLRRADVLFIDFFQAFIEPLEQELGRPSSRTVGRSHGMRDLRDYMGRMNAVNFALAFDDGLSNHGDYQHADVILLGVSRSGKTPTCLFLALQYGVCAANYPITEEDFGSYELPRSLVKYKSKILGLTISPKRLAKIRQERLPHRRYAQLRQCEKEVSFAEAFYHHQQIPYLDTTSRSIEELAVEIMAIVNIKRRINI